MCVMCVRAGIRSVTLLELLTFVVSKNTFFFDSPSITAGKKKLIVSDVTFQVRWVLSIITALFNNVRTLKFKAQPTNAFLATVNQMFGGSSQLPTMLSGLCSTISFDYRALGSSRKLGGAAEHLIDGSGKHICRLIFEF